MLRLCMRFVCLRSLGAFGLVLLRLFAWWWDPSQKFNDAKTAACSAKPSFRTTTPVSRGRVRCIRVHRFEVLRFSFLGVFWRKILYCEVNKSVLVGSATPPATSETDSMSNT
jgi:hypothetical protein